MSIEHHPTDSLLAAFAAGTLDHGQHVAIATHLVSCPQCRAFMRSMEQVGGAVLTSLPPAAMSNGALAAVEARLNEPERPAAADDDTHGARDRSSWICRNSCVATGSEIGNGLRPPCICGPSCCPMPSDTRVFLLKSGPGTKMLEHAHTGFEMTCVLSGAFSQDGGHFGPGDFDLGDETWITSRWSITARIAFVWWRCRGSLRLNGLLGRIMQPFVRL